MLFAEGWYSNHGNDGETNQHQYIWSHVEWIKLPVYHMLTAGNLFSQYWRFCIFYFFLLSSVNCTQMWCQRERNIAAVLFFNKKKILASFTSIWTFFGKTLFVVTTYNDTTDVEGSENSSKFLYYYLKKKKRAYGRVSVRYILFSVKSMYGRHLSVIYLWNQWMFQTSRRKSCSTYVSVCYVCLCIYIYRQCECAYMPLVAKMQRPGSEMYTQLYFIRRKRSNWSCW